MNFPGFSLLLPRSLSLIRVIPNKIRWGYLEKRDTSGGLASGRNSFNELNWVFGADGGVLFPPHARARHKEGLLTSEALSRSTLSSMVCAVPRSLISASRPDTPKPREVSGVLELLKHGFPRFRGASSASRAVKMWLLLPPPATLRACRRLSDSACGRQLKLLQWRASTRRGARRRLFGWRILAVR